MNTHQAPKATHSEQRRIPAVQVRAKDLIVIRCEDQTSIGEAAENVGQAAGGIYGTVIKAWHSGHGRITALVKHDRALHPTGCEQVQLDATKSCIVKSAL